jgi:hypothetical protein
MRAALPEAESGRRLDLGTDGLIDRVRVIRELSTVIDWTLQWNWLVVKPVAPLCAPF